MKVLEYELKAAGPGLLVQFPHLGAVIHATSTRQGGVSGKPFDSLNLGLTSGDDLQDVQQNRQIFSQMLAIPLGKDLNMDHGTDVVHLHHPGDMQEIHQADASITNNPQVSLSLTTADCVPIFFFDPQARAIGLAHAGWRGTVNGIAARTVEAMVSKLGAVPQNILVALGPAIARCCFEVGAEVAQEFHQCYGEQSWIEARGNKWHIDLHQANRYHLLKAGISDEHIRSCPLCTCCRPDLFYSWRKDQGQTGRLLSAISLGTTN